MALHFVRMDHVHMSVTDVSHAQSVCISAVVYDLILADHLLTFSCNQRKSPYNPLDAQLTSYKEEQKLWAVTY